MMADKARRSHISAKIRSNSSTSLSERIGQLSVRRLALKPLMMITMTIIVVPESIIRLLVPSYPLNHELVMPFIMIFTFIYGLLRKKSGFGRSTIAILLYCVLIVVISRWFGQPLSYPASMYMRVATIATLFDCAFRDGDEELIEALADALLVISLLNLAETLRYGDLLQGTMGRTFLLGFDNGVIITTLPTLVVNLMVCFIKKRVFCLRSLVSTLTVTATVIVTDSSTSTVGFAVFWLTVMILLISKNVPHMPLNACKVIVVIPLLVFYWVVLLRTQRYLTGLVVNVLHREMTFTGRTILWDIAMPRIVDSPIMGYGLNPESQRLIFFGVSAAHNQILDILYQTGIVGFICYVLIVLPFFYSNRSWIKSKSYDSLCMSVLMGAIFAFLIMMQFESYSSYVSFGLILSLFVAFESVAESVECATMEGGTR